MYNNVFGLWRQLASGGWHLAPSTNINTQRQETKSMRLKKTKDQPPKTLPPLKLWPTKQKRLIPARC